MASSTRLCCSVTDLSSSATSNMPNITAGQLNPHAVDIFSQYGLRQHVNGPTHASGNMLDLILSRDEQINQQLISNIAVQSVCFSDHHLLTCRLGVLLLQPVTKMFTYRSLHRIHMKAFCLDILQSRLFGELDLDDDRC